MKLQKMKNEVYLAEDVENAWAEIMTVLKNNLLGLPSKLSSQLENKSRAEIFSLLNSEIEVLLSDVSSHS